MKKYDFKIKIEGLLAKSTSSVEHDGSLDGENIENAAKQVLELAKKLNGEFKKCNLILEEK